MADPVQEEINEQFRVLPDEYTESQERKKQSWMNRAAEKRAVFNRQTRRALETYITPKQAAPGVTATLYFLAYDAVASMVREGHISGGDTDTFQEILEEFRETADPMQMKRLGDRANRIGREPAELRKILDENGTKISELISWAFHGTEPLSEGSAGQDDDEPPEPE